MRLCVDGVVIRLSLFEVPAASYLVSICRVITQSPKSNRRTQGLANLSQTPAFPERRRQEKKINVQFYYFPQDPICFKGVILRSFQSAIFFSIFCRTAVPGGVRVCVRSACEWNVSWSVKRRLCGFFYALTNLLKAR